MTKPKPERLGLRMSLASGVGVELHWVDRKIGESLQGWYHTLESAESAARQLVEMGLAESTMAPWVTEAVTE